MAGEDFRLTFSTAKYDGSKPDTEQIAAQKMLLDGDGTIASKVPSMLPDSVHKPLRALIVVTGNSDLGALTKENGRQTGVFLEEAAQPIAAAVKAGMQVDVASPQGGAVPLDPLGLLPDYMSKVLTPGESALALAFLSHTKSLNSVEKSAGDYDVVFVSGGHGASFDFPNNKSLQNIIKTTYEKGNIVAAMCHGPDALDNVILSNGKPLVEGKKVTMLSHDEEVQGGLEKFMPPHTGEFALKARGAIYSKAPQTFVPYSVRDGNLITGENPMSAEVTILNVQEALKEKFERKAN